LAGQNILRVATVALALCALSFAAGVAGDLAEPPQTSGVRVVLRIPPELPDDTVRAGPIARVIHSQTASASTRDAIEPKQAAGHRSKSRAAQPRPKQKTAPDRAAKPRLA